MPLSRARSPLPPIVFAFGAVMRAKRLEAEMSQTRLAQAAGISLRYVTLLEKGEYQASITVLHDVAAALGLPLSEMIRLVEARMAESA